VIAAWGAAGGAQGGDGVVTGARLCKSVSRGAGPWRRALPLFVRLPTWHHAPVKPTAKAQTRPKTKTKTSAPKAKVKKAAKKPATKVAKAPVKLVTRKAPTRLESVRAAKPSARKPVAKHPTPAKKPAPRADLGEPIDGFFARQPEHLRAILDELRALVDEAAPDADSSLKWGMPFYTIGGNMMCALAGFKAHVNLIMAGPPDSFADPDGRLEGDAKTGRHIKLRAVGEIPHAAVREWLRTAAERARQPK
jgi:hypothetical protein